MNPQSNPLDQLRDIHLPDGVSMWPIAWPWWLLLIAIIAAIAVFLYFRHKNSWRSKALAQFDHITQLNDAEFAQAGNRLLKQISLSQLGQQSASYTGTKWLNYLDQQVKHPIFLPDFEHFHAWVDQPNAQYDRQGLETACRTWIRKVRC